MRRLAMLAVASLLVACGNSAPEVPPKATGLIVEIEGSRQISSFVLESEGESYTILIDPERDYGFPLEHLREHQAQKLPVIVTSETRDGSAHAVSIEDG
ncbi:MAG TPA: hypothetical protein VEA19_01590 [Actinomycetota bacterium]|nr:hypothetical protein [Actinomycetota bacterium]